MTKQWIKSIGLCCTLLLSLQLITNAQEEYKGLPDDLNTSKVIFLKYEKTYLPSQKPQGRVEKIKYAYKKRHNSMYQKANEGITETAKLYPFEYIIATRADIEKFKADGYKYVFDSELLKTIMTGERASSSSVSVSYPFYLQDLTTNDIYLVDDVPESKVYYTREYMKTLIRQAKRKYKVKNK